MAKVKFLSAQLIADDYLNILQKALEKADFARFVVGYVSSGGIQTIGQTKLARVLQDDRSFGVASLACATGFEPFIELQKVVGTQKIRLKYFLDPCNRKDFGEPTVSLVHTKLAYIKIAEKEEAIILLGSHNWSKSALGGNNWISGRNAEASVALRVKYDKGHIDGSSNDLGGIVNSHLLSCWNLHACLEAAETNRSIFEQWITLACKSQSSDELKEIVAILAVDSGGQNSPISWSKLKGSSIYAQIRRELPDGELLWNKGNAGVVILVWGTEQELQQSKNPILIFCHVSTFNATPSSSVGSSNAAGSPVEGFRSVLWERTSAVDVRGISVEHYELNRTPFSNTASKIDGSNEPKYRFLLEVDEVILPTRMAGKDIDSNISYWKPGDLAFSEKNRVHPEKALGYLVDSNRCSMIRDEFINQFGLQIDKLKAVPVDKRSPREGLRISKHDLHCTFVSDEDAKIANEIYSARQIGDLVPEVDLERAGKPNTLIRTSRVFMQNIELLKKKWNCI